MLDVHFHFSNHQLPISEQEQLQKQLFRNEMTTIEAVKNESPPYQPPIRNTLLVQWLKLGIKCTIFVMGANSEPGNVILLCQLMENVAKFLNENVRIQML